MDKDKGRGKLGAKIRAVRERRALTLREVAEKAGVSESLVSQIERNRVSPAIDTLLSIADALDLDPEYLFADLKRDRKLTVLRAGEGGTITKPGVLYERLAQMKGDVGIEAYRITLEAGARTGNGEYGHQGWELGMVESGRAELTVGNRNCTLGPGDSVSFRSDSPHALSNAGAEKLRVIWVITPPKGDIG
ncbi:MAG: XRE family transcriptional regulator [Treponema sp.]|jgi:transcriptional regulator with XRE-family HTH domain|nr:XRE family transcriptional regulator [Treponema sp.]